MSNRAVRRWSCKIAAATLALGFMSLGIGSDIASAANTVGLGDSTSMEQSSGTNNLKITLSEGNPEDDGAAIKGLVEGVTIHLDRLEGIDPKKKDDLKKVDEASLDEIQAWTKDRQLSGVTDANGVVKFSGLEHGIYFVWSSAPNDNYREINSFLVAVPFHTVANNPNPVEGVIVAKSHTPGTTPPPATTPSKPPKTLGTSTTPSKPAPGKPDQPSPSESTSKSGSLALTGVQVTALVIAAAVLIGAGFLLIASNRRSKKES